MSYVEDYEQYWLAGCPPERREQLRIALSGTMGYKHAEMADKIVEVWAATGIPLWVPRCLGWIIEKVRRA